jgi:hypothetical protein
MGETTSSTPADDGESPQRRDGRLSVHDGRSQKDPEALSTTNVDEDGNEDAASIDAEAERTCITLKSASRLTDQAHVPNPFKATWFGSPSNAWVRVIELPVAGMF